MQNISSSFYSGPPIHTIDWFISLVVLPEKERELRRREAALVDLQEMYENRMLQMKVCAWWHYGMETFYVLPAFCKGIPLKTGQ